MGLSNYWGYNTYSHFAVEPSYADNPERAAAEFKQTVKALHQAGLEVILDVVYNHYGRAGRQRPDAVSARYRQHVMVLALPLSAIMKTGRVTAIRSNIVRRDVTRWATDSLRYWAEEFHVDGFRFDLGTVLGREPDFQSYGRFFQVLYQDPVLADLKLIVEAWDIGEGGYHGAISATFAEWNGRFRDDMRAFWSWESGNLGAFAERLARSSDIFNHSGRHPSASINFITARRLHSA